jgi:hypothetical protein
MRFKYIIEKNDTDEVLLKEYTEIEEERYSLLNEMVYDQNMISSAVSKGENHLLSILRTDNMYPPRVYAAKLSEMVTELLHSDKKKTVEIILDDLDFVDKKWKRSRRIRTQPIEEEPLNMDDAFEECTDNTCTLKNEADNNKPDLMEEMFPFDEVA